MATECNWWYTVCTGPDFTGYTPTTFCAKDDDSTLYRGTVGGSPSPSDAPPSVLAWWASLGDPNGVGSPCNSSTADAFRLTSDQAAALGLSPCTCPPGIITPQWYCIKCLGGDGTCTYFCGTYSGVAAFFSLQNNPGGLFDPSNCPDGYTIVPLTEDEIKAANLGVCGLSPDPNSVIQYCNGRLTINVGGKICRCGHYGPSPSGSHIPAQPSGFTPGSGWFIKTCPACGDTLVNTIPKWIDFTLPAATPNGKVPFDPVCLKQCGIVGNVTILHPEITLLAQPSSCEDIAGTYRLWWTGLWAQPDPINPTAGCCYLYLFQPGCAPANAGGSFWQYITCCLGISEGQVPSGHTLYWPISVFAHAATCYGDFGLGPCIDNGNTIHGFSLWGPGSYLLPSDVIAPDSITYQGVFDCSPGRTYSIPSSGTGPCCTNGSEDPTTGAYIMGSGAPASATFGDSF